ncbi:xylulokinase [Agromyces fucosus]|nr:xylulokinase [Agromyces fucosus]
MSDTDQPNGSDVEEEDRMPIVAGVDASTQSSTVELRDADSGALLGTGRAAHPETFPPVSEQHPSAWWSAVASAFAAAAQDAGVRSQEIRAISVGAQCHGLVLLDHDGVPLHPAKLWNDTTSAPQAARLLTEFGGKGWADAVGSVPTAAFTITKLAWMAEYKPELLGQAATVLLPHDYLTFRLTGRFVTDRSDASGTGYFAAHEGRWRTDLLDRVIGARDWDTMLPTVLGPDEAAGTIAAAVADELGLDRDVLVGAGGGDQHLSAVGIGLANGDVAYSLGTSGVVMTASAHPVFDPEGIVTGVASAVGGYLPLACTLNATKVTDWAARMLGVSVQGLGELALRGNPADRPVLAAFLDGERTPNRPDAVGVLAGLTTTTTREELARAAFEGVLLGLVEAHARLGAVGAAADGEVTITGGGARSSAFRQLLADLLGRPISTRDSAESTARGAALQASAVLRERSVADVAVELRPDTTSVTDPQHEAPARLRDQYRTLSAWTGADRRPDAP